MRNAGGMPGRGDIVKEGWVLKQSKYRKEWRRRWLVLSPTSLCTYHDKADISSRPTEILFLKECSKVKSADEEARLENAFRVDTPQRVFLIVADSWTEKESWIGNIGRQMVRPTVLKEQPDDPDDFEEHDDDEPIRGRR